ncbi:MFS transporter [Rugosimonospora africana]|uniref:MFS transporter n=1 Tax=Rugosimonospora africana TaxID=556532 RepID=A0A8J3QY46_9ACTN|nr:MFS transporter [Rugosimonospora africana]GIH18661.1 MFS transporter [Rugosimonospora africana]
MARRGLIFGHRDFRRLWIGETVSQFGSQVSMLAMPLIAALTLRASTFQVGVLSAVGYAPFLVFGLLAGAWVDRARRRPVLIASNLLRAAVLVVVPVAAALRVLSLAQLYVVEFALGLGTLFFDVAYQSYLPALIGREHLVEGNGRLEASRSTAYALGPGAAGSLVQALTAPVAVLVDAASFVWSAAWICAIRGREPAVPPPERPRALLGEVGEGLRLVAGHRALRALALYNASAVLFLSAEQALEVVFLVRTVRLSAAGVGLLFSVASVGAVLGAFAAGPLGRHFGEVRTIVGAALLGHAFMLLVPLTVPGPRLALFGVGTGVCSFGVVVFNIVSVAFRQRLCPDRLLGRMNATMRFLSWGMAPVGALLGGVAGAAIGTRATLWCSGAGGLLPVLWLLRSSPSWASGPVGSDGSTVSADGAGAGDRPEAASGAPGAGKTAGHE